MSTVAAEQALNRPVSERGEALLSIPEDQWFDRKSARMTARDLSDAILGFANAEGGLIVVGLWNGEVEGVSEAPQGRLSGWQQAAIDFIQPPVRCRTRRVECVSSAGVKDHLENRRLTFAQCQELLYDKGQASFEATAARGATFSCLDQHLLASYAAAVNHPDARRLLAARGLLDRSDHPTAGVVLLFGSEPEQWFPEAHVRVLRYAGSERGTGSRQQLLDDVRIIGPIPKQLMEAREAIFERLPTRRALAASGRFERVSLVPQDAWLEGLVNAVIHRSYSMSGDHIRVEIFDDRVEIESPGRFPGIADTSDPLHVTRFARNPRIARVCADLNFGQELGEGIRRIYEEMRIAGLADPTYVQTSGSVRLTLTSTAVDRARASTGDLVSATGRSRPVIIRQLKALADSNVIEWMGSSPKDPRAYWRLRVE